MARRLITPNDPTVLGRWRMRGGSSAFENRPDLTGSPSPPDGYAFVTDGAGLFLVDDAGALLIAPVS